MGAQEEAVTVTSKDHTQQILIKRKRTKRQRLTASLMLSMSSSSSSIEGLDRATASISPTTSTNLTQSTTTLEEQREKYDEEEEEDDDEDMANCLMLLAQGGHVPRQTPKKSPIVASTNMVYECKTCDRSFHSFQALGGHRASHKKFKSANYNLDLQHDHQDHHHEKMKTLALMEDGVELQSHRRDHHNTTLSLQITNPTRQLSNGKVHECSICGAEFSSGQALGGHMRRHRSFPPTTTTTTTTSLGTSNKSDDHTPQQAKKLPRKNGLSLDLNLPASSEDEHHHHRESKFAFVSSKQVLAFSASTTTTAAPLVDCQY